MKYHYFISFFYTTREGKNGWGNAETVITKRIKSIEDIKERSVDLMENNALLYPPTIVNFQLLRVGR